jgi:hypothetical protein
MCHDNVKFQYWLSSEYRVNPTHTTRHSAIFRLDFSGMPPGDMWQVQLCQYSLQGSSANTDADDKPIKDSAGADAPVGIISATGFSMPYSVETATGGNSKLSSNLSRIDLNPYMFGKEDCCINPNSAMPLITVSRPTTGDYQVNLRSGVTGLPVVGSTGEADIQPWVMCLEFTLVK